MIKEKRYEDTKKGLIESPFFRCERYSQNRTTGLRPWKCNSSVSYTNLCAIYSITITDNWYMRHLPFQGKVKTGLRPFFPNPPKFECYAKTGQGWDKNLDSLCSILESELKTLDATFRFHTGGSLMKYTKKERMNIGRQIYEDQINKYEAAGKYGISAQTAREYMRMYRNTNHLPPKTSKPRDYGLAKAKVIPEAAKLDEYQKMSKEDLISALIDARIREERLKLGYEVVEEDDSKKSSLLTSKRLRSNRRAFRLLPCRIAL